MALSIYVGPPGSGKTYTAVESIAIPAAKAGRTIITNIKGINPEVWAERFFIEPEKIRVVDDEWFKTSAHYPKMGEPISDGIPAGALVLIDEAYTVFPSGKDVVSPRQIEWVRTHRHFVAEDGVATDLVLISQDVMSLHPRVRSVVEYVSSVRNLRHVGFGKRFRVDVYSSWRMNKPSHLGQTFHRYDAQIFDLYKSFEAEGAAKVVLTDNKHKAFKLKHALFLLMIVGLLGYAASRVTTATKALSAKELTASVSGGSVKSGSGSGVLLPCDAVGGVVFDVDQQKVFHDGKWEAVKVGPDGHWIVDGLCVLGPGERGGNARQGNSGS
jgi:zona occludens toxin